MRRTWLHQALEDGARQAAVFGSNAQRLMHFLAPSYLHFLWLAAIPLVLWLYRRRAKRVAGFHLALLPHSGARAQ